MARDIAFVADKDTRDDLGAYGDPIPVADVPPSEGGPVTRDPAPASRSPEASTAESSTPKTSEAPPAAHGLTLRADALAPTETFAAPNPEPQDAPELPEPTEQAFAPGPVLEAVPAPMPEAATAPLPAPAADDHGDTHGAWRTAIADALFEPSPPPEPEARPSDEARPGSLPLHARASIELLPERPAPAIQPEYPPQATEPAREQPAEQSDASFTAAAQDLFRPPEIDRDPHLITLGRRLDPSLRIPRPVAPVIAPRPVLETRYEPDPETDVRPTWKTGTWRDRLWIAGRYAAYAAGGYLALVLVLIVLFRFVNPPGSMLMLTKLLTGNSVDRTWVPLDQISPNLVRAVIVSEDGRFCEHSGIDTVAIKDAIEKASGGIPRGASTISMQVTKNLFLWNAKSYIRKVIEIPLTLVMEIVWPKRRILEMYLNIAEWGPGVFGAEAAARHHFNKPAYRLNEREAALLAAVLPNPVRRDAGSPNTVTSSKARVVQSRVKAYGAIAACVVGNQPRAAASPEPAAAQGNTTATPRNQQPARKATPQRKAPRRETIEDWGASVRMGPQ